jgi:hypothetical protein
LRQPTVAGVQALSLEDVKAYDLQTMRPDLTTIVVVGNVTADRARADIEKAFGGWHASGDTPALDLPAVPRNAAGEVKLEIPSTQDYVTFEQVLPTSAKMPGSCTASIRSSSRTARARAFRSSTLARRATQRTFSRWSRTNSCSCAPFRSATSNSA